MEKNKPWIELDVAYLRTAEVCGAKAIETLRGIGQFRIVNCGGQWRLVRLNGDSWHVNAITNDHWTGYNTACLEGLEMAKAKVDR